MLQARARHCEFQLQSFGDPQAVNRVITVRFITIALQQTYFFLFPKGDKSRCWSPTVRPHNLVLICRPHGLQISQMAGQTRLLPVHMCNADCTFTTAQFLLHVVLCCVFYSSSDNSCGIIHQKKMTCFALWLYNLVHEQNQLCTVPTSIDSYMFITLFGKKSQFKKRVGLTK